jgi:hypothetical protein
MDWVGNSFDREPAGTADDGIALNPVVRTEVDRPRPAHLKPARNMGARLQQRQNFRKRIHNSVLDDREENADSFA